MMVPVRTWQHRQQLVEYQRSHGEIIIVASAVSQHCAGHQGTESPLSSERPLGFEVRRGMTNGTGLLPKRCAAGDVHRRRCVQQEMCAARDVRRSGAPQEICAAGDVRQDVLTSALKEMCCRRCDRRRCAPGCAHICAEGDVLQEM
ncbi:unnamed protein product [Pleuronectes platessa]|uniref:Uncharacterized protein n=1 Tax=Pleuronectes platessa TaxID=8262 RepID=A0A9N7U237_PLEPL|nr:unnamed protein product [Pleuronectes platessa]